MTPAQLVVIKNDITTTRSSVVFNGQTLLQLWNTDRDDLLEDFYKQQAVPTVLLWRPNVRRDELLRDLDMAEFIVNPITQARREAWMTLMLAEVFDATDAKIRKKFSDILPAGGVSITDMTATSKRPATYGEGLFVTSVAGAFVSSIYGYTINATDIGQSRSV